MVEEVCRQPSAREQGECFLPPLSRHIVKQAGIGVSNTLHRLMPRCSSAWLCLGSAVEGNTW